MAWQMQIKVHVGEERQFQSVHPVGGKPYEYATEEEAWNMLNICYPDQIREQRLFGEENARVIEVD